MDTTQFHTQYAASMAAFLSQLPDPGLRIAVRQQGDPFFRQCALAVWQAGGTPLSPAHTAWYNALYSGIHLLPHRVIKINGLYCITPSFFRAAYRGGQLKDTVVLSETCEFLGVSGSLDTSMADALLAGGAKAVAGYVNNVYTVYSRSMLWDTVNHLILGQTLQESVQHSMDTYGADDLVWYNAQGGKRPHAAAAYPLLFGDVGVRLIEPNAAPAPQEVQQAA